MTKTKSDVLAKKREDILSVSAKLFAKHNYHEVLMDDVAEKTGLGKGTIYNYFVNKEDLYFSIMISRLEALLALLKERIDQKQTPMTNLRRIIIHTYSFMAKYPFFFSIWYREKLNCDRRSHQKIQLLYKQIKQLLITGLERGISEEILRPHKCDFVADIVMGMIDAAVIRTKQLKIKNKKQERLGVYEFLLEALGTPKAHSLHFAGMDEPKPEEEASVFKK